MDISLPYDLLWVGWGIYFLIVESIGIYKNWKEPSKKRRTLSSLIWFLGGTEKGYTADFWGWIRRLILGIFMISLTVHFISGGQVI